MRTTTDRPASDLLDKWPTPTTSNKNNYRCRPCVRGVERVEGLGSCIQCRVWWPCAPARSRGPHHWLGPTGWIDFDSGYFMDAEYFSTRLWALHAPRRPALQMRVTARTGVCVLLHRAIAAAQCIVIGPVCLCVCVCVGEWVCVFVGGSVTTITRNCVCIDRHQTGFVGL